MKVKISDKEIIEIKEFSFDMIQDHSSIIIIGNRGQGKTTTSKSILFNFKNTPKIIISEQDKHYNHNNISYENLFPECFLYDKYNKSILKNTIKKQKNKVEKYNSKESTINPKLFIVFDDYLPYIYNLKIQDKYIKQLLTNNDQLNISYIINTDQYSCKFINKYAKYIFVFDIFHNNYKKNIYNKDIFKSFEIFNKILTEITKEQYRTLVIVNNDSCDITDKVFWYKTNYL